jgi:hypothetical protein
VGMDTTWPVTVDDEDVDGEVVMVGVVDIIEPLASVVIPDV